MKSEIKSAKDESHKTGYSSEDNLDNKAKLAHYQEQIKLAKSGENYTTSFNWKPSEEPSYIDKKLLEQEKQEASEGLSVLQYNARSIIATEKDKEAYDNALNKVLFTTEQIDNINNGQAYQMKEGGPTYSSSTPQQQNNHLAHFTNQLDVMGSESTGFTSDRFPILNQDTLINLSRAERYLIALHQTLTERQVMQHRLSS